MDTEQPIVPRGEPLTAEQLAGQMRLIVFDEAWNNRSELAVEVERAIHNGDRGLRQWLQARRQLL